MQQELLGADLLQELNLPKNNDYTRYHIELINRWFVSFHPVVGASVITWMSLP